MVSTSFRKVEIFMEQFNPYLNQFHDNTQIDYDTLVDPLL